MSGKGFILRLERIRSPVLTPKSQQHPYPLLLYNFLAMITWAAGGYSIISISFSNAKPGNPEA